jgi:cellulose synthase/poly-beta-1,6-N-acetylglucosamine synthase-like glycosyltransferase
MTPLITFLAGLNFLEAYALVFCMGWMLFFSVVLVTLLRTRHFETGPFVEPASWPRLSIIVAARNEAGALAGAAATLLEQDYPDLELILIDDRSTDGTGAAIDQLAREDGRIKPVHIAALPDGWLGKVHAHHVGTRAAAGEWILYTDADIHFAPGTLKKGVAMALGEKLDHLVLLADSTARSFRLDVVFRAFEAGFIMVTTLAGRGKASGTGGFSLMRRSAFDRTPGFEWLRMEAADDVGLGRMLQARGARCAFATGFQHVSVEWYPTLRAMFRGLEKNFFAAAHYSAARLFLSVGLIWGMLLGPAAAFLSGRPVLIGLGAACLILSAADSLLLSRRYGKRLLPSLLLPAGFFLMFLMQLRSGLKCLIRGGMEWRGTFHSLRELRAGQRVRW